ncbi:MAG TPA: cell division protein ZipA C-terminal FtsZ-binding domain-containing protein [Gammaproteobacteria bacterium]|nr:cell division protein ZipA C-terminal FtsZ-binding domain-containing protein [Gammaproteobacteria bacterium]
MELRLILLLIGAAILAAIWLSWRHRERADQVPAMRAAPTLGESGFPEDDFPSETIPGSSAKSAPVREQGEQLILALHVMPRDGGSFAGAKVLDAFDACNLRFGRYQVYHRLDAPGGNSVFSVANVVEPGSLDPETLDSAELPGLTLFMVLPGPRGGVASYADMLATSRQLAQFLDGEVLDQERSTLTRQTARHIRERIITFETQLKLRRPS